MGNQQHHYSVLDMPAAGQWKQSQKTDHCVIIKNQQTGEEAEVYTIGISDDRALVDQLEMYEYRKINKTKLVSVINVQKANSKGLCSGTNTYKIITERIPLRLSQIQNLQIVEAMYILKQSLEGFELINQSIDGPIEITKEMIGFTPDGKVKIWVNPNFAINMPEKQSFIKGSAYQVDESSMPLQLIHLVESQLPNKSFPSQFKVNFQRQPKNTLNFPKIRSIVKGYCSERGIPMLQRLNLFEQQQNILMDAPKDSIVLRQQTTIQNNPPTQVLQQINSSANQTSSTNKKIVQGHERQKISHPLMKRISQQSIINKVGSVPSDSLVNGQILKNTPINKIDRTLYPNNTMEFPIVPSTHLINGVQKQIIGFIPQEFVGMNKQNFNEVHPKMINYQEAINYQFRPSINTLQAPVIQPQIQPARMPSYAQSQRVEVIKQQSQSPERQIYQQNNTMSNQIKPNQFNQTTNYRIPIHTENFTKKTTAIYQNNGLQSQLFPNIQNKFSAGQYNDPKGLPQNGALGNPSQFFSNTYFNQSKFQPKMISERTSSPLKNNPYLKYQTVSHQKQSPIFSSSKLLTQNVVNDSWTPSKYSYQYSTGKKSTSSPRLQTQQLNVKRNLFKDYQPQFRSKNAVDENDDLILRIQRLTNNIKQEIEEVTAQYKRGSKAQELPNNIKTQALN